MKRSYLLRLSLLLGVVGLGGLLSRKGNDCLDRMIAARYANKILILIGNVLIFMLFPALFCFPRCSCAFSSKSGDLFVYVKKKL